MNQNDLKKKDTVSAQILNKYLTKQSINESKRFKKKGHRIRTNT